MPMQDQTPSRSDPREHRSVRNHPYPRWVHAHDRGKDALILERGVNHPPFLPCRRSVVLFRINEDRDKHGSSWIPKVATTLQLLVDGLTRCLAMQGSHATRYGIGGEGVRKDLSAMNIMFMRLTGPEPLTSAHMQSSPCDGRYTISRE